ncbi:hypothetical protein R3P38DRAFT_3362586 [Favolaschia claudopus]|uniref:Uncharacterized protein n=1 Tax=Favolaschia claudopus TaxID=2862362 RepID=A0AAW0AMY8_9AGAR
MRRRRGKDSEPTRLDENFTKSIAEKASTEKSVHHRYQRATMPGTRGTSTCSKTCRLEQLFLLGRVFCTVSFPLAAPPPIHLFLQCSKCNLSQVHKFTCSCRRSFIIFQLSSLSAGLRETNAAVVCEGRRGK